MRSQQVTALGLLTVLSFPWGAMAQTLLPPARQIETPVAVIMSPTTLGSYRFGPGDQLEINVFDSVDLSGSRLVAPDGTITLPLIGVVQANDRTAAELAVVLQERFLTYLKKPIVTVTVAQFRPLLISIAGEVRRPGPVQMKNVPSDLKQNITIDNTNPSLPSLSAALKEAGGVTRAADISQVVIKRRGQLLKFDLWQGLTSENAPQDQMLQDGDAIFVPKIVAGSPKIDPRLVAKSTIAPQSVKVRVVGEVKKPGEFDIPPNSTVSSAMAIAGGATDKAKLTKVALVRLDDQGKVDKQFLNLENMIDSQQIQDGDVILVPKSRNFNILDIAGQALPPLGILMNLLKGK
ncbi:MAG: polysaccharide export protein [Alkalinema sp. RU_4_3]|nr:polysaccharide export protein [Alkalinema sp. RU_4_3]